MKYKVLIITSILLILLFFSGITYSMFHSSAQFHSSDQNIAKFVFNDDSLDQISLQLQNMKPGDTKEYLFTVTNNKADSISDVAIKYQMNIKTFHFLPITIQLYKLNGNNETLIITCDESFSRNSDKEIICNTPEQEMGYATEQTDNYKLKLTFPIGSNNPIYSDLIDYIDVGIRSWQRTGD